MGLTHVTVQIRNLARTKPAYEAEPILGVVALENTAITVDPLTHTLKRPAAKPLK